MTEYFGGTGDAFYNMGRTDLRTSGDADWRQIWLQMAANAQKPFEFYRDVYNTTQDRKQRKQEHADTFGLSEQQLALNRDQFGEGKRQFDERLMFDDKQLEQQRIQYLNELDAQRARDMRANDIARMQAVAQKNSRPSTPVQSGWSNQGSSNPLFQFGAASQAMVDRHGGFF